ncbi:MAG: 30S ribosomal protein S9 [Candidatus Micrarchaeaceae archaeon]
MAEENDKNEAKGVEKEKQAAKPRRKSSKAAKKAKGKVVIAKGKRKEAVARASIRSGSGKLTFNGMPIEIVKPEEIKSRILEAVMVSNTAAEIAKNADIEVKVKGGGSMSQANAARTAIAKAIVEFSGDNALVNEYMHYDRSMIAGDSRRVEAKKYKGPKARARFQTSYR